MCRSGRYRSPVDVVARELGDRTADRPEAAADLPEPDEARDARRRLVGR
jgi:hypothetical protein